MKDEESERGKKQERRSYRGHLNMPTGALSLSSRERTLNLKTQTRNNCVDELLSVCYLGNYLLSTIIFRCLK